MPNNLSHSKKLRATQEPLQELEPGYTGKEYLLTYGGVRQRVLLVHSQQAQARGEKSLQKAIEKKLFI